MLPKDKIKAAEWYQAYEQGNVATALQAALVGRGQIGKVNSQCIYVMIRPSMVMTLDMVISSLAIVSGHVG